MLDSKSSIPLYHQLKSFLEAQINSGVWKPGDRVPSESDLGAQFRVSRTTVRLALGDLVNQGLLSRAQGKGTFVAQARILQPLSRLTGFTQDMAQRNMRSSSEVLKLERIPVPAQAIGPLRLEAGHPVVFLWRLRMADGTPMAMEAAYINFPGCEALLKEDLSRQSMYQLLHGRFNIHPLRASQQIEAVACPAAEARLLQVHKGSPVLRMVRTTCDQNDRPFEMVESFYRGDRYVFNVELTSE